MEARFPTAAAFSDALEAAAQEAGVLGSHRDVATHLDSVIGTDISQQRDAVRAWLARSEPSKHGDPRLDGPNSARKSGPKLPMEQASLTRIEGAGRTSKIVSDGSASNPDLEATISQPSSSSASSMALPVPNPAGLGDVSSVSSAILSVAGAPAVAPPVVAPPPAKSRTPLVAIIVVLLFVIAGGGIFAAKKINGQTAVTQNPLAPTSTAQSPTADGTHTAPADNATANDKFDSGATAAAGSAAASSSAQTSGDHARHGGHGHGNPQGAAAGSSTSMPDDISHNPYR